MLIGEVKKMSLIMAEYPDKCAGWSDLCECNPEWRGVVKEEAGFTMSWTTSDLVVHCNIKENAELIAKILDADSDYETYKCCETCGNYFSENAAETCIGEEV